MNEFIKSPVSALLIIILNIIVFLLGNGRYNLYGLTLVMLGGYIYLYNRRVMGAVWTVRVEKKNKLITKGLFKYVRHPLYLGMLIVGVGGVIISLNLWLLVIFIFIDVPYTYARARLEEEILSKNLKGYKSYMKQTGMFLPKIK